jgi:hypothetical protein
MTGAILEREAYFAHVATVWLHCPSFSVLYFLYFYIPDFLGQRWSLPFGGPSHFRPALFYMTSTGVILPLMLFYYRAHR